MCGLSELQTVFILVFMCLDGDGGVHSRICSQDTDQSVRCTLSTFLWSQVQNTKECVLAVGWIEHAPRKSPHLNNRESRQRSIAVVYQIAMSGT